MLPEFRSQLFQLPLIATTWTYVQNKYIQEKKTSLLPIRFTLSMIEQTISSMNKNIIQPFFNPYHSYLNYFDNYLCSRIDSIRHICPIVNQTSDEIIGNYGDLVFLSFLNKNSKTSTSTVNNNYSDNLLNNRKENKFQFIEKYFQFLTNILMIIEMYSKYIQNELNDYIGTSRNLWKNLNMEDGRSLDEVESFSEKLLVLGRRMTGNYRQFVYLMRYQLKRCRYILFSFLRVQNRFRSTIWRMTRKIKMNRINRRLNERTRYGLVTSRERVRHYLEVTMLHASKHPWMRWKSPQVKQTTQPQFSQPIKSIRPIFFFSSNNTSDCSSEPDENIREQFSKIYESTPYRKTYPYPDVIPVTTHIENVLSDICSSSSSSDIPEQSFDVKEIIRQVGSQLRQTSDTSSSIDQDEENRVIEQALNESEENDQQQKQSVSVFDLSPMLASGCAV